MTDTMKARSLDGIDGEIDTLMDRLTRLCDAKLAIEKDFEYYRPVIETASRVFGEQAWAWLSKPVGALNFFVPIELAKDDPDTVLTVLGQIEGGVYI